MREFMCTKCGHKFDVPLCNGQKGWQISCPQCNSQVVRVNTSGNGQYQNMGQGSLRTGQGQGKSLFGFGRGGNGNFSGSGSGRGQGAGQGRGQGRGQGAGKGFCRINVGNNNQIKDTGTTGNKNI